MRYLLCLFVIGHHVSSSRVGARACVRPGQGYIPTVGRKRPYGTIVLYELAPGLELDRQDPEIGTENVNGYDRALFPHSGFNLSTAIGDPVHASGATSAWSSGLYVNGKWQV